MQKYQIKYKKDAIKFIKKNPLMAVNFQKTFEEISQRITNNNVLRIEHRADIKKLVDPEYDDMFRLRIGKYRAIFRVIDGELIILVLDIDSRGGIYK